MPHVMCIAEAHDKQERLSFPTSGPINPGSTAIGMRHDGVSLSHPMRKGKLHL
jgi:hypothetical protein